MKLMTRTDLILGISIILIAATVSWVIPNYFTRSLQDRKVVVSLDGQVVFETPLEEHPESRFVDFPFVINGEEYQGRLEMKNGQVRLHRLAKDISPLSIHADMGWISQWYQSIVSLPIKMVIRIEGNLEKENTLGLDAVSF